MTIRIYLFLINVLIAFIGLPLDHAIASGGKPQSSHQNEVKNPSELNKDIKNKLTALISQCDYESNINNSEATFDSLFCDAISLAESTFDPKLLLDIYLKYIDRVNSRSKTLDFKKLVEKTESLALEFQDENQRISTWIIISKGANELRYASIAQKYALKALSELDIEHDSKRKVEANLCLGKSFEIQNLPKEAYQNYLNALYETEFIESKSDYDNTVLVCNRYLFNFFNYINDYKKASSYKLKELEFLNHKTDVDSLSLFWAKYDMAGISIRSELYAGIKDKLNNILSFADRTHNKKLKDYTLSLYRTYLIEESDFGGFPYLYEQRYPNELNELDVKNPVLFNTVKAYISEHNGDNSKAKEYFNSASDYIKNVKNDFLKSNFYIRYGEFLIRENNLKNSIDAFENAYEAASKTGYLDHLMVSAHNLDSLNAQLGIFDEAYKYSKIYNGLTINKNNHLKEKDFLSMELEKEAKQMKLTEEKRKNEQKKKFNLQYLIITLAISALFVFFILLSSLKVSEWVIRGLGFLSVLMLFEFVILILDHQIHHLTHGAPLWIFVIKVAILFVLFPLHHLVEHWIIKYMISNQLIRKPNTGIMKKVIHLIWPWMKKPVK